MTTCQIWQTPSCLRSWHRATSWQRRWRQQMRRSSTTTHMGPGRCTSLVRGEVVALGADPAGAPLPGACRQRRHALRGVHRRCATDAETMASCGSSSSTPASYRPPSDDDFDIDKEKAGEDAELQPEAEPPEWDINAPLQPAPFNVMLTCYTLFERDSPEQRLDRGFLEKWRWSHLIMDEAHALKNRNASRTTRLRRVSNASRRRIMMTGTLGPAPRKLAQPPVGLPGGQQAGQLPCKNRLLVRRPCRYSSAERFGRVAEPPALPAALCVCGARV